VLVDDAADAAADSALDDASSDVGTAADSSASDASAISDANSEPTSSSDDRATSCSFNSFYRHDQGPARERQAGGHRQAQGGRTVRAADPYAGTSGAERREGALHLVRALHHGAIPDERVGATLAELERIVPYPHWLTLPFHTVPELSDEGALDEAIRYRPFAM
jgi:hypothetical protein